RQLEPAGFSGHIAWPSLAVFSLLKQQGNAIVINQLPVRSFSQHCCQRRINGKQRSVHSIPCQDRGPIRTCIPHAQSVFHECRTIEIRSAVVEDSNRRPKAVNQISTPLPA